MKLATKPCMWCLKPGEIEAPAEAVVKWAGGRGPYVQDAFPMLGAAEREQILTGTHPECWTAMFPVEEEEEADDQVSQ